MRMPIGIHVDHPWSKCAKYGAPLRVYIRTPWGFWQVGEKSQVYDRKTKQYPGRWSRITYRPTK